MSERWPYRDELIAKEAIADAKDFCCEPACPAPKVENEPQQQPHVAMPGDGCQSPDRMPDAVCRLPGAVRRWQALLRIQPMSLEPWARPPRDRACREGDALSPHHRARGVRPGRCANDGQSHWTRASVLTSPNWSSIKWMVASHVPCISISLGETDSFLNLGQNLSACVGIHTLFPLRSGRRKRWTNPAGGDGGGASCRSIGRIRPHTLCQSIAKREPRGGG